MMSATPDPASLVDKGIYCLKHNQSGKVLSCCKNNGLPKLSNLEEKPKQSQLWRLSKRPNRLSYLISMGEVPQNALWGTKNENTLRITDWHGQSKYQDDKPVSWTIEKGHKDGVFYVVNGVGKVLNGNGNEVNLSNSKNKDSSQMWELIYFEGGEKLFFPVHNEIYCFRHLSGNLLTADNKLPYLSSSDCVTEWQLWNLRRIPDGTFLITMFVDRDKMLYGAGDSPPLLDKRSKEKEWCRVKPVNWKLEKADKYGFFYVINGAGKILDGDGNENKVYLWNSQNKSGRQMWELIPYSSFLESFKVQDPGTLSGIAKLVEELLAQKFSRTSHKWGVTYNNEFPENWLIQIPPKIFWGENVVDQKETKKEIWQSLGEVIIRAEKIVHIMTLDIISGGFIDMLIKAIEHLEVTGKNVTVQIFLGLSIRGLLTKNDNSKNAGKVYYDLIKGLTLKHVSLIVASGKNRCSSFLNVEGWTHAKIVAVDGKEAIVGGMNMYGESYLSDSPVHDLSVHIKGTPALRAQLFVEHYWAINANITEILKSPNSRDIEEPSTFRISEKNPIKQSPIITVGRDRITKLGDAPSDVAILKMLSEARKTIYISQQKMFANYLRTAEWEDVIIDTICSALLKNKELIVKIVTSQPLPLDKSAKTEPEDYPSIYGYYGNLPDKIKKLFK